MCSLATLSLFLVISSGLSFPEKDIPNVRPEFLDTLLETGQYELFAEIMNIPDAKFVVSNEDARNENEIPMFNKDLEMGDIMPVFGGLKDEDEARQSINFNRYGGSKWPNGYIPYYIRESDFTEQQRKVIDDAIIAWNRQVGCLKLRPYRNERDYVFVFSGNGCWSYLGKIGGQQGLSLQRNGCVWKNTVLHEFQHAAGFSHEHNRLDRDDNVDVLWENIPDEWRSQYEKNNARDFVDVLTYDYYSIMHYPMKAPGTNKDAFRIKANGIDRNRIGNGQDFTQTDIGKIQRQYC